jgi:hypothetical protein
MFCMMTLESGQRCDGVLRWSDEKLPEPIEKPPVEITGNLESLPPAPTKEISRGNHE